MVSPFCCRGSGESGAILNVSEETRERLRNNSDQRAATERLVDWFVSGVGGPPPIQWWTKIEEAQRGDAVGEGNGEDTDQKFSIEAGSDAYRFLQQFEEEEN